MAGGKKMDRRGSGPWWFIALAFVVFCLYSLTVAASTADKCNDGPKEWQFFPPAWECVGRPGFG